MPRKVQDGGRQSDLEKLRMIRAELDAAHECNYAIMAQLSSIEIGITRMVTFEPSRVHEAHLPQISG